MRRETLGKEEFNLKIFLLKQKDKK
jgi:hypothetical protein